MFSKYNVTFLGLHMLIRIGIVSNTEEKQIFKLESPIIYVYKQPNISAKCTNMGTVDLHLQTFSSTVSQSVMMSPSCSRMREKEFSFSG